MFSFFYYFSSDCDSVSLIKPNSVAPNGKSFDMFISKEDVLMLYSKLTTNEQNRVHWSINHFQTFNKPTFEFCLENVKFYAKFLRSLIDTGSITYRGKMRSYPDQFIQQAIVHLCVDYALGTTTIFS